MNIIEIGAKNNLDKKDLLYVSYKLFSEELQQHRRYFNPKARWVKTYLKSIQSVKKIVKKIGKKIKKIKKKIGKQSSKKIIKDIVKTLMSKKHCLLGLAISEDAK